MSGMSTTEPLALLQAFLNSHHSNGRDDWFDPADPEAFDEWAHGPTAAMGAYYAGKQAAREAGRQVSAIVGAEPSRAEDVAIARDVRDGLLAMLAEGTPPEDFDRVVRQAPVRLGVTGGGVSVLPAVQGPVGLAASAVLWALELQWRGVWERLRLCRSDSCHWAFLDQSKNRSRVWCDMATCGAKAKAKAYRERRRSG